MTLNPISSTLDIAVEHHMSDGFKTFKYAESVKPSSNPEKTETTRNIEFNFPCSNLKLLGTKSILEGVINGIINGIVKREVDYWKKSILEAKNDENYNWDEIRTGNWKQIP